MAYFMYQLYLYTQKETKNVLKSLKYVKKKKKLLAYKKIVNVKI